ncbi:hypothetical protein P3342_004888 [Pyrenophora teres f. teres]|nr:hypothetical protein P3342_004888 [Pyrenophora teres f. teres]
MIQTPRVKLVNSGITLSDIVNLVQGHGCNTPYCQRKNKATGLMECRFGFPHDKCDEAYVAKHPNHSYQNFFPARNDSLMNKYNRLVTMSWQANTDVSPCTSTTAVMEYVAKYAAKPERASLSYRELAQAIIPFVNEARPFQSLVMKLMNKLLGERDYSAQEVCHQLLGLPLKQASRTSVHVDMRPLNQQPRLTRIEDGEVRRGFTILEHYMRRPDSLDDVNLLTFLRMHKPQAPYNVRPQGKARIVNYFPRYPPTDVEDYRRSKLMFHHPFKAIEDLLFIEGTHDEPCRNFFEAYEVCHQRCNHEADGFDNALLEPEESVYEPTQDNLDDVALNNMDADWGELARQLLNQTGANGDAWDQLRYRPEDRVDWSDRVGKYPDLLIDWWKGMKVDHLAPPLVLPTTSYENLELKQRLLYDTVLNHYKSSAIGAKPAQLLLHLDGKAGTGKTTVVQALCNAVNDVARDYSRSSPILRAAPTGIAACNFGGSTLHSLFRFNVKSKSYQKLSPTHLRALQDKFRGVKYLIIDEKSMVSIRMLTWIHLRLEEIFPRSTVRYFPGVSIILAGDFFQLPPVAEKAIYNTSKPPSESSDVTLGKSLYKEFNRTITLDIIKRQTGNDAKSQAFRLALNNLRVNKVSRQDWALLTGRVRVKLQGNEDLIRFEDAIRIFAYKDDVKAYNHYRMAQLKRAVLLIKASHTGGVPAETASTDEAGNLHTVMPMSINARIMLRDNHWIERRLFNGSMATVRDMVWPVGADCDVDPPFALLVDFDEYNQEAPYVLKNPETGRSLVPIFRVKRDWVRSTVACTRTQFPITIAYAITVHKSQDLSVATAVLNPGKKQDFSPGLTYVAVSRVRTLDGLLIEEPFDLKRLKFKTTDTTIMRARDLAIREGQEIPLPLQYNDDGEDDDLPVFPASQHGRASQMSIPLLPSEPFAPSGELRSTITVPSEAAGTVILSDVAAPPFVPPPRPPLPRYVDGLLPRNLAQYNNVDEAQASQGDEGMSWFECVAPAPFCNRDPIPIAYRAFPGINICIWCNHRLGMDYPRRRMWCTNGQGHDVVRSEMNLVENTFCNTCEHAM